ncbi:polysaccharide biosynthesis tyrosine autokinase [Alphaproteobacteria bacterium KMM 3653]|uniref:non-specific protein-tyrosine kinase n=1 Tax=Harenicola maris TaxID=2841044 RepID=A0AAP2CQV3_9RHOB|nr:polysaccharide biosynthesis tyrosine autokinase [Harenicola maris]
MITRDAEAEDVIDLGALVATLWRGKWIVAVVAAICVFLGGFYAYRGATPVYRSTAVVLLEVQQPLMDLPGALGGLTGDATEVNSELEVLRARGLVREVVLEQNLVDDPEFNGALREPGMMAKLRAWVGGMFGSKSPDAGTQSEVEKAEQTLNTVVSSVREKLSARNVPNSLVFEVSFESESPRKAARLTDAFVDAYLERQINVKFDALQQAVEWLSSRVAELQVQLEEAEQARATFSSSTDLVSVEGLQLLERQLKDLRDRVADQDESIAQRETSLTVLQGATTRELQAELSGDRILGRLIQNLGTPSAEASFDARVAIVIDQAQTELARLRMQRANLDRSATDLAAQIEQQNADLIRLQQLNREAESIRLLYETFLTRLNETAAQQGVQKSDSVVLSNAVIANYPISPRKSLILAMAGVLGLMLGSLLVLLREARSSGFRIASDLEKAVGQVVLGQIPLIPARGRAKTLSYVKDKPASAAAEAIRNLRTGLMYSNIDNPPRVIMVTSSIPAEGKTMTSIALALNLAATGQKVLLIEGDIRRRTFKAYFPALKSEGVVSVLNGDVKLGEAVQRLPEYDIDILSGEESLVNAADLYSSKKFAGMIQEMREVYDIIVIDTPPVLVVPDARIIANVADAVLLCVKWDSTSEAQVAEAMRLFRSDNTRVTGLALTQISLKGMQRYGYGGTYGAYGKYGNKYYTN